MNVEERYATYSVVGHPVDDSTYSLAESDPEALSRGLTAQYEEISKYMAANKLVINADKTHLLVLGTRAMGEKRN